MSCLLLSSTMAIQIDILKKTGFIMACLGFKVPAIVDYRASYFGNICKDGLK